MSLGEGRGVSELTSGRDLWCGVLLTLLCCLMHCIYIHTRQINYIFMDIRIKFICVITSFAKFVSRTSQLSLNVFFTTCAFYFEQVPLIPTPSKSLGYGPLYPYSYFIFPLCRSCCIIFSPCDELIK
jgi:hypothetical protein